MVVFNKINHGPILYLDMTYMLIDSKISKWLRTINIFRKVKMNIKCKLKTQIAENIIYLTLY